MSGPTHGEVARDELRARGLLFFVDVEKEIRETLEAFDRNRRIAFAARCAQRAMKAYESLPPSEQHPYTLGWRPVLDAIWRGLEGEHSAYYEISHAVGSFYLSPQNHIEGPDGPQEADEDAADASLNAALCYLHGCVDFAMAAASRAFETVYQKAADDNSWTPEGPIMSEFGRALAHPLVQGELADQLADVEVLRPTDPALPAPPSPDLLAGLRR